MQSWVLVSEIVRNLGLALAAFGGVVPERTQAGSAAVQAELARRAHVTELFVRAAGQLGDDRLEIRLSAIYVLREIGKDFPDLANPAFELLQAYLRERQARYREEIPPIDIRIAMDTVQTRVAANETA